MALYVSWNIAPCGAMKKTKSFLVKSFLGKFDIQVFRSLKPNRHATAAIGEGHTTPTISQKKHRAFHEPCQNLLRNGSQLHDPSKYVECTFSPTSPNSNTVDDFVHNFRYGTIPDIAHIISVPLRIRAHVQERTGVSGHGKRFWTKNVFRCIKTF